MLESLLFYLFSFGALLFALGVVFSRSAIYSVLSLVAAMCMISGLFVLLKAFLVATILILVYAGAILVLFLFVVMLIDFKKPLPVVERFSFSQLLAIGISVALFAAICKVIRHSDFPQAQAALHGTAQSIGRLLFDRYVLPFELISFLLLAAVVSVVVLAKKDAK